MTLKCIGCGKFMGKDDAYMSGPMGYVSHMKKECMDKLVTEMKKTTPKLDFFEKSSMNDDSMRELISAWGMYASIHDTMPIDEIADEGIED